MSFGLFKGDHIYRKNISCNECLDLMFNHTQMEVCNDLEDFQELVKSFGVIPMEFG